MKLFILLLTLVQFQIVLNKELNEIMFEENSNNYVNETPNNLRTLFTAQRDSRQKDNERLKLLENLNKSDDDNLTVIEQGIAHHKVNSTNRNFRKIRDFEREFRRLISSEGVKFVYKRNFKWRTWRRVLHNGVEKFISYLQLNVNTNSTDSNHSGVWNIDEHPPCPYEVESMETRENLCVLNYNNLTKDMQKCSNMAMVDFLMNCDNPLITHWKFEKIYNVENLDANLSTIICGREETCEFFTFYEIYPDRIVFRLTNPDYTVLYSKVMKPQERYDCIANCGILDPATMTIEPQQLRLNLLDNVAQKKKREMLKKKRFLDKKLESKKDYIEDGVLKYFFDKKIKQLMYSELYVDVKLAKSSCKTLKRLSRDEYENNLDN